jgi:hypothetical protein
MLRLFVRIGELAATRPGALETIELFVDRAAQKGGGGPRDSGRFSLQ